MPELDADLKVCRIASLTLINAMTFQQVLAYKDARIEPLARSVESDNVADALLRTWDRIVTEIDYVPIFAVAREVLRELTGMPDSDIMLRRMAKAAERITGKRAALRHDLMGRIYHRLLADAKYFGAFYTTVPAASLLLRLTFDGAGTQIDWSDLRVIEKLRVADLACGTGTLLKAALQTIIDDHVRACAAKGKLPDMQGVHKVLIEKVLWGLDVVPFAIHLAGSALALHEPDVEFGQINLSTLPIGGSADKLGSLELLTGSQIQVQADLFGPATTPATMSGGGDVHDNITLPSLDLCVMNPPFTRSVGGNLLFGHAPKNERVRLRASLRRVVSRNGIPANITAGLGSVFVALGHQKLNANGRMSLVLPRALLSGVAWRETRTLLGNNYHVKYIIVSHEPHNWNFSENTELSECMTIADWVGPEGTELKTKIVNLWRKPKSSVEALTVASAIRKTEGAELESNGTAEILVGRVKYGEVTKVSSNSMRQADWNEGAAFAQTELCRVAHYLRSGRIYVPGIGILGTQPTVRFKDLGEIGPDRRDIHDGFRVTDQETEYPALWGSDTAAIQCMDQPPNKHLIPLARATRGRNLRDPNLLWSRSGRLFLAERLRLTTARLVAVHTEKKALSNTWWPVGTYANQISALTLDKIMTLWFNSSLGLIALIAARVETQGPWIDLKKPILEQLLVMDPRALSTKDCKDLCKTYDKLKHTEIGPLPAMKRDAAREEIDRAIARALQIDNDFSTLRTLLANEPIICGLLPV